MPNQTVQFERPLVRSRKSEIAFTTTPSTSGTAPMQLLPLHLLGARETSPGVIAFGILLPQVTPALGAVAVKVIHERDQFLQRIQPVEVQMTHSTHPQYGDLWSGTVDVRQHPGTGGSWGQPGKYVYRYILHQPKRDIDWIVDPFAREYGVGKLSAFTLGYAPYTWAAAEASYRTPRPNDLVVYELMIQEFGNTLQESAARLPYLADLGVNCVEIMPLSNVTEEVEWGFRPIAHFGVDERFGKRDDLQRFVEAAHSQGIAVVADVIYGHTDDDFAYEYLYNKLGIAPNPFMGVFAKKMFGPSTDWNRTFVRDFFFTVNVMWLDWFHLDGFRYDCVPEYWSVDPREGYGRLVWATYQHVKSQSGAGAWARFSGAAERIHLIQIAEQLEAPQAVVKDTYSTSTWQNETYAAAQAVASAKDGAITWLGHALGLDGYPTVVTYNGVDTIDKVPLQYIENHDQPRFITNFGLVAPSGEPFSELFREGNREVWWKLQPYLIALLLAKGAPLLFAGQELGESNTLPGSGRARVRVLRPVRWNFFYDDPGKGIITLVRNLLALRKQRPELRGGDFFFYNEPEKYQNRGVLMYSRWSGSSFTLVGVNFSMKDATVPFWFPGTGPYSEKLLWKKRLDGEEPWPEQGEIVPAAAPRIERTLTIPSNFGRVWCS